MLTQDAWSRFNIWDHSATVLELYRRRARGEEQEMTCAAQAADILSRIAAPGERLLDVGCGTGYFFHSLRSRAMQLEYWGIDATQRFIEEGRRLMAPHGLPADRLAASRIEDMDGEVEHVLCMNVLSNLDNFHKPLERMLLMARRSVVLRESIKDGAEYSYVLDRYLDGAKPLRVYVNAYDRADILRFISSYGFEVEEMKDWRTGGAAEMVIDHPHYWTFLVATRRGGASHV
jgi:ubiquinone/menaquinone biosynthesis C-methylase UbiE